MTSSSYRVQSDSINFAGNRSTSTSYISEDTLGEIATGQSTSTNYRVQAGYQQMQQVYLAVTVPPNVTLTSIPGLTGGTSNGSTYFKVTTDNLAGYTATLKASSSVGMLGIAQGGNIPAYVLPAGTTTPEFSFSVPANKARFGYTVEASTTADLATAFKDTGSICGAGSADAADKCWLNASTTAVTIMNRTTATPATGATTTIKFRVTIGSNPNPIIPQDTYVATTTITVLPL